MNLHPAPHATWPERLYVVAKYSKLAYDKCVRRVLIFVLSLLVVLIFGHLSFPKAYAAISFTSSPSPICQDKGKYTLAFDGPENTFVLGEDYTLMIWPPGTDPNDFKKARNLFWHKPTSTKTYVSKDIDIIGNQATIGLWRYKLWFGQANTVNKIDPARLLSFGEYSIFPKETCELGLPVLEMPSPLQINSINVPVKVRNINPNSDYVLWFIDGQKFNDGKFPASNIIDETIKDKDGNEKTIKTASLSVTLNNDYGLKTLCLKHGKTALGFLEIGKDNCEISIPVEITINPPKITPTIIQSSEPGASLEEYKPFSEPEDLPKIPPPCATNAFIDGKCTAVDTAIGRINTEPVAFIRSIFSIVLGLSGGIALILIIISGYRFMVSQGNPEVIKGAQQQLMGAIIGLLFIIFSFVILQVVGVDILKIPGFGN